MSDVAYGQHVQSRNIPGLAPRTTLYRAQIGADCCSSSGLFNRGPPVVHVMKNRFRLSFRINELFVLLFELLVGSAGLMMIVSALRGNATGLDLPALALSGLLPGILVVGYSSWLVYRLRCVGRARSRFWGLVGAACLGVTAIGFGAAVGKLSLVFMSPYYSHTVEAIVSDPLQREAGLSTLLAFMGIGFVFGVTFVMRAGKRVWQDGGSSESLHRQVSAIGETVVSDWREQLVSQIDVLVEAGRSQEAIRLYVQRTGCSLDEASCTIADWSAQRLRLELEVLGRELNRTISSASVGTTVDAGADAGRAQGLPPEAVA